MCLNVSKPKLPSKKKTIQECGSFADLCTKGRAAARKPEERQAGWSFREVARELQML